MQSGAILSISVVIEASWEAQNAGSAKQIVRQLEVNTK
jgi:hypothetical protein